MHCAVSRPPASSISTPRLFDIPRVPKYTEATSSTSRSVGEAVVIDFLLLLSILSNEPRTVAPSITLGDSLNHFVRLGTGARGSGAVPIG